MASPTAAEIAGLLIQHQSGILGYILACLRDHSDADDVFQEVSIAAVELRGQLVDREGFLPWVRQIARFRVLKHIERSKRLVPMSPELINQLAEVADEVDSSGTREDRARCLNECVDALPASSRHMILKRYADTGSSVEDIARDINRSVQATYALLKRIRIALRECVVTKMKRLDNEPAAL